MADEYSGHSQDQNLDRETIRRHVDELRGEGDLASAWKLAASYCVENLQDTEMLTILREIERARMGNEPTGTRISFAYLVLNGMPFMEHSLKSIYDFAHEIVIVEGAVENCMFAANPDGSSTDGTVEFIRSFPDPDGKIRLIQGRWPEKMEMTNEAIRHISGDYIWLMASDEVYRREDIEKTIALLKRDSSITQVDLIPYNFWKGFDYVMDCPRFLEPGLQFQGPLRFLKGARFVNHRPLQLKYPGYMLSADYIHRLDGTQTREAGIRLFHYSYVLESQVYQKIELYRRYGWGKSWELDLEQWYEECFLRWTPENREQVEREYPVWTGDRNSCTVSFDGKHPEVMREFIAEFRRGGGGPTHRQSHDTVATGGPPTVTVKSSQGILDNVAQFSRNVSTAKLIRGDVAVRINAAEFRLQRIGTEYGGWVVPVNRICKDSICYCVGAGEDVSFDVGLVRKYGCDVHTFDPTPRAKTHIDLLNNSTRRGLKVGIDGSESEFYDVAPDQLDKIHFHPYGIWSETCVQKFYAPRNPVHVSHSILNIQKTEDYFTAQCLSLADAMTQLGHDRIDLLKIDVEGAEYAIVDSIVSNRIPIGILCLEFDELNVSIDDNYAQRIKGCIAKLLNADYVPLFIDGGGQTNYTFVQAGMCSESDPSTIPGGSRHSLRPEEANGPEFRANRSRIDGGGGDQSPQIWPERETLPAVGDPLYQKMAVDAWRHIELDEPLRKRESWLSSNIAQGTAFWNNHVALCFLASNLNPDSYLEIGVRSGGSLIPTIHSCEPKKIVCVDLWADSYGGIPNSLEYTQGQVRRYQEQTGRQLDIEYIKGDSHSVLNTLIDSGAKFNLITVDGDHSEAGAWDDLADASMLLAERGAIVFDDIIHPSHPYLMNVAMRFAGEHPEYKVLMNSEQDNGCVVFLKGIDPHRLLNGPQAGSSSGRIASGSEPVHGACSHVDTGVSREGLLESKPCGEDLAAAILRRPKYIKIETTNICNANCSFCAYDLMTRPKGVMAMDVFKRVVQQYAAMGGGQITISPEVGDCLVDAKLLERLRYCREFDKVGELGFHSNMIGLDRWTDEQVLEIIGLITWWACSVGPNRDVYKDMFGVDQFDRVVANLERLRRLLCQSPAELEIEINGRACGGAFSVDERLMRLAQELIGEPIKWMRSFGDWGGKLAALPRNTEVYRSDDGSEKRLPCMKPLVSAVIFHDGKVGFCGCADYDAKLVIGDVNQESLESILGGEKRRAYLESFGAPHLNEYCRKCTFYEPLQQDLQPLWAEHQRRQASEHASSVIETPLKSDSVFGLRDCVSSETVGGAGANASEGTITAASSERQAGSLDATVQRVLWVRTDSIGDNVLSASMLEHVHSKYPNAGITVVCQEHIAELYDVCPYVDEVVSFNRVRALKDGEYRVEVVERLRNIGPKVALNSVFSREPLTDIFTAGSHAEQRIALDGDLCNMSREAKLMYNRYYTRLLPSAGEYRPELGRHKDFLRGLGIEVNDLGPVVWTDGQDEEFARDIFERNSFDPQRTVALFPSAQHFHKAYESYDRVAEALKERKLNYVVLGGNDKDARQQAELIRSSFSEPCWDLTGQTTIRQTAAIIRKCGLYLGSDSAGAHIACAVGTPNVAILGGGHFGRFIPYSPLTATVCLPLECYQCRWNCRYERPHCVKDIAPSVVAEAVNSMMETPATKPRMFIQRDRSWQPSEWQPGWVFSVDGLKEREIEIKLVDRSSADHSYGTSQEDRDLRVDTAPERSDMGVLSESNDGVSQVGAGEKQTGAENVCSLEPSGREKPEGELDVSIVICTRNRAELLDRMLASLNRAARDVACEVIVVEGGSSDSTLDILRNNRVTQIYSESECLGQGRHSWPQLYNFGFSKARGRWAMYASDDIIFSEGAIDRAVRFLDGQKDEAAGGIFFYRNSRTSDPQWSDYGIDITHGCKLLMNYGLVRLDYFRGVGGLDESYRFYCADTDLCYKLYERSLQLIPLPGCLLDHDNVMDKQKSRNMAGADADIELLLRRWRGFVSPELPNPRRLLWMDDLRDAFSLPAELDKLDSSVEDYWHGLACLQQGLFHEAREKFVSATDQGCNHWRVWFYLAKAVSGCRQAENSTESQVLTP